MVGLTWAILLLAGVLLVVEAVYAVPGFAVTIAILLVSALAVLVLISTDVRLIRRNEYVRFRELFTLLSDGIIVMDPNRSIVYINPSAARMTGFGLRDVVPFCLYCQRRTVQPGQERCLLATERHRHYFESQMPTKTGDWVNVGMSRTFLMRRPSTSERDMVITIRDVGPEKQEEELRLSRRLTHHTYEVQEEERKRLSQELHDGVSQTLYGVSLGLEHLARHLDNPALQEQVQGLHGQVRTSIEEVRALSRALYPAVLYHVGLVAALRSLSETLSTVQRDVSFRTNLTSDAAFPPDTAVHLYRIVQEALHNAILHGHASQIAIKLRVHPPQVTLEIVDNGRGFLPPTRSDSGGYGLRNMEERARAIQAVFRILSQPDHGTTVTLTWSSNDTEAQTGKETL